MMVSKIDDSGPAFPGAETNPYADAPSYYYGMSRRDWISGQALVGLLASGQWNNNTVQAGFAEHIVMHADEIADAWLAARASRNGEAP